MNSEKLSKRLEKVSSYITVGSIFADIGSDHAYLPVYAILNGLAIKAIAGEVVEGPYKSARQQVLSSGLSDVIDVRMGDGLEVIKEGEVNCVTIAGMGGSLIASILEAGKEKLTGDVRLILQPNIAAHSIRKWLITNGWELINEAILEEDGKIYEILVAENGDPLKPYKDEQSEILLGPFLKQEKSEVFKKKWDFEKKNWQKILLQLEKAEDTDEAKLKKQELINKITIVEEVLES